MPTTSYALRLIRRSLKDLLEVVGVEFGVGFFALLAQFRWSSNQPGDGTIIETFRYDYPWPLVAFTTLEAAPCNLFQNWRHLIFTGVDASRLVS